MLKRENGYYPFLESTKSIVKSMNIGSEIDDRTLALAKQRVLSAIKHGRLQAPSYFSPDDISNDVKSYAVSRLMVSLINRKIDAFVEAESSRALEICMRNHEEKFLMAELGIEIGADMHIPLRDYLIFGSTFSIMLLSNRSVKGGLVKISPHEINVILKEAIKHKISDGLPIRESLINEDIKKRLKPALMDILSEISLRSPALGRQSQDLAPCMERVIEELHSGAKVPHLKRWALAVFLVKRGWDNDKIVEAFSHAPNYDERIVRYQLDHVRAKGYLMPSCRNLITQGICVAECGTKNPLQFTKDKLAKKKPAAKSSEEESKEQSSE